MLNIIWLIYNAIISFSYALDVNCRVSFYVVVEGKDDEVQMKQLEAVQRHDAEEETSHIAIKSALETIQQLQNKAKIIQWERQQSLGQDMFRMEATLCKSV